MIGTALVWTYLLFNDGTDPIDVFGVMDDRGTPDVNDDFVAMPVLDAKGYNVGDLDHDGLLDHGEVWRYTSAGVVFGPGRRGPVRQSGDRLGCDRRHARTAQRRRRRVSLRHAVPSRS